MVGRPSVEEKINLFKIKDEAPESLRGGNGDKGERRTRKHICTFLLENEGCSGPDAGSCSASGSAFLPQLQLEKGSIGERDGI